MISSREHQFVRWPGHADFDWRRWMDWERQASSPGVSPSPAIAGRGRQGSQVVLPTSTSASAETTTPDAVRHAGHMSPGRRAGRKWTSARMSWAFGCCLFECLSGRRPHGRSASDLIAEVLKSEPDWSQIPVEIPRSADVPRRCLKDSTRRLSSLRDIAITLDESLADSRLCRRTLRSPANRRTQFPPPRAHLRSGFCLWRQAC